MAPPQQLFADLPRTLQAMAATKASAAISTARARATAAVPTLHVPSRGLNSAGKGVLIGLLSAMASAIVISFVLGLVYFLRYTTRGRILLDRMSRPGEFDDEQAFAKEEAEALEEMDDLQRAEYMRAKAFVEGNPPESVQTDISLSQFLAIQEKGVSAWEFEPALEIANCFVEARTEIEFYDTECSVQTNLPVPKQNEVYYWEAKIYDKPDTTLLGIGFTTKPYPLFRMPGYHKTSVAYLSPGHRRFNQPFAPTASYGPPYVRGDVIGVGYRPRTGTVFFTRNGKKLDDVTHTLKTQNLFPTVGATGAATIHVNFGHAAFVYIEANVKKWGLAPMTGSLAPPPPYGSEQGSILLDQGQHGVAEGMGWAGGSVNSQRHARSRSAQVRLARVQAQRSPGPQRSPTDISLAQLEFGDERDDDDDSDGSVQHSLQQSLGDTSGIYSADAAMQPPPPDYESPPAATTAGAGADGHGKRSRHRYGQQQHAQHSQHPHRRRRDYFDRSSDSGSDGGGSGGGRRRSGLARVSQSNAASTGRVPGGSKRRAAADPFHDDVGEYHDDNDDNSHDDPHDPHNGYSSNDASSAGSAGSRAATPRPRTAIPAHSYAPAGAHSQTRRPPPPAAPPLPGDRSPPVPYEEAVAGSAGRGGAGTIS